MIETLEWTGTTQAKAFILRNAGWQVQYSRHGCAWKDIPEDVLPADDCSGMEFRFRLERR